MLGAPKPLASLSSGLLARKGQARPAMRPQGFASLAGLSTAGDALGWNDMGEPPVVPPVLAEREALHEGLAAVPAESVPAFEPEAEIVDESPAPGSLVALLPPATSISIATATRIRRETAHRRKTAFTLRLDEERHLRLRLASATRNRSAQQLVTEALDVFIATLPEVETLVAQLPPRKKR